MFRSKIKLFLTAIGSAFLFLIIVGSAIFLYEFPAHPLNIALFKATYKLSPIRKSFLTFYSPARRDINNNYAPLEVNHFLINKIKLSNDENEIAAIVHFYSIQAESHRIGYFDDFQDEVKPKIINELVKALDDNENLRGKLLLLEEIRTNKRLGKGTVGISEMNHLAFSTIDDYDRWFDKELERTAKPKYQEWWNSNLSWEEKKKINPLEGTNIKVSECCG